MSSRITSLIQPFLPAGNSKLLPSESMPPTNPTMLGLESIAWKKVSSAGVIGAGGAPHPVFGRRMLSTLSLAEIQIRAYMVSRVLFAWALNSLA